MIIDLFIKIPCDKQSSFDTELPFLYFFGKIENLIFVGRGTREDLKKAIDLSDKNLSKVILVKDNDDIVFKHSLILIIVA